MWTIILCRKPEALLMRAILPRSPKIRGGVLGQHEDGGSEYLIRKIGAYGHLEKIQFFCKIRSKTLQNVTCELEKHHLEVVAPE